MLRLTLPLFFGLVFVAAHAFAQATVNTDSNPKSTDGISTAAPTSTTSSSETSDASSTSTTDGSTDSTSDAPSGDAPLDSNPQNVTSIDANTNGTTTSDLPQSPLALVYINTEKPGLGTALTETVFKENSLAGVFNTCKLAEDDPKQIYNTTDCFQDDQYNDRLTFEVSFKLVARAVAKAFEQYPPSLKLLGQSAEHAASELQEVSVDTAASTAKLTVLYRCHMAASGFLSLQLTMQFTDSEDSIVTVLWTKQCESGLNSQVEFGYTMQSEATGETRHHPFASGADAPLVVVPSDKSTEVYAKLLVAGAQQQFLAPFVFSEDPDTVQVSVRGNHPNGGSLQGLKDTGFQVSYECLSGKGSSNISVSVGIPPFQNLTASWEKECGGIVPKQLSIGSAEGAFDIVDLGKPTPKYMVGIDNLGTAHSEEHLHLHGNETEWTIYLSYVSGSGDSGEDSKDASLHLGRVLVTVEHPDVIVAMNPAVSRKGSYGWTNVQNSDNLIREGDKIRISFRFACRKVGESRLLFSIPLVHYDLLEFGIAKECDHVNTIAQVSKEFVLTAGDVFWGLLLLAIGSLVIFLFRKRSNSQKGFEQVPTMER